MTLEKSITEYGCVEIMRPENKAAHKAAVSHNPSIYTAKITALFLPYISKNVNENKFLMVQERLTELLKMKESKEKIEEQKELIRKITDINDGVIFFLEQLNVLLKVQQDLLNKILEELNS